MVAFRPLRRAALGAIPALALALVLVAQAVPDAAAQTRNAARGDANDFILWCVGEGGNPTVVRADGDGITVACAGLPGGTFSCSWWSEYDWSQYCSRFPRPIGDLPVFEIDPNRPVHGPGGLGGFTQAVGERAAERATGGRGKPGQHERGIGHGHGEDEDGKRGRR